ncbi:hypothetical protein BDF22DRAFT_658369 [Syncephalis plumigaleata]|nr:hypothetical protein BDF22DRAFT_658369 [Syncephalis plumigaleata]
MPVATRFSSRRMYYHHQSSHQPRYSFLKAAEEERTTVVVSPSYNLQPLTLPTMISKPNRSPRSAIDRWENQSFAPLLPIVDKNSGSVPLHDNYDENDATTTTTGGGGSGVMMNRLVAYPMTMSKLHRSKSMPTLMDNHRRSHTEGTSSTMKVVETDASFITSDGLDPRVVLSPVPPRRRSLASQPTANATASTHMTSRGRRQSSPSAGMMKRSVSERFLLTSNCELLTEFGPVKRVTNDH